MKTQKNRNLLILGIAMLAFFFAGGNAFADQLQKNDSYVETRDDNDDEPTVPTCVVGGCGTGMCTIAGSASIWVISASLHLAISCTNGYYACCNPSNTHCFDSSLCPAVDTINDPGD